MIENPSSGYYRSLLDSEVPTIDGEGVPIALRN